MGMNMGGATFGAMGLRCAISGMTLATALAAAPMALAQPTGTLQFDIAPQALGGALAAFTQKTGITLAYGATLPSIASQGASGALSSAEALSRILAGTGMTYRFTGPSTITLEAAPVAESGAIQLGPVRVEGEGSASAGSEVSPTSDPAATEGSGSYTTRRMSSATGIALSIRDTPQSVSVITRQEIEDQDLATMTDVLSRTPGIIVSQMGTERANIVSRGFSPPTFKVDGMEMWYDIVYNDTTTLADMTIFDRVEVVRGATGLMDGAGNPSGTINLIRKRPTREWAGAVAATAGSWNDYRTSADVGGPLNAAGTIRARLVGSYRDSDSYLDRYNMRKAVVFGTLEADLGADTMVTVGWDYQRNRTIGGTRVGLPLIYADGGQVEYDRSTNSGGGDLPFIRTFENKFVRLDHDFANGWHFQAAYNRSSNTRGGYDVAAYYGAPDREGLGVYINPSYTHADTTQDNFLATLTGTLALGGREHDLAFGVTGLKGKDAYTYSGNYFGPIEGSIFDWNGVVDDLASLSKTVQGGYPRKISEYGVYGSGRFNLTDRFALLLGSRLTWTDFDYHFFDVATPANDYSRHYEKNGKWLPYAAATYRLDDNFSVYASYTTIFKQQEYRDANNQPLLPTEGVNYEIGLKAGFYEDRLNFAASLYRIEQDKLAVRDPAVPLPLPDGSNAYMSIDGAVTQGFEIELSGEVVPGWQLSGSFSHARQEDKNGKRITTNAPVNLVRANTVYAVPGTRLTLGGNLSWQDKIYNVFNGWPYTGTARQDGYALVGLLAKYALTDNLTATVNLNNLFDKKYLATIDSTFATGLYGAPRNVVATVRYRF